MVGARVIGYLDCSTGVSGDKFLGALLDAGAADGVFTGEDLQGLLDALVTSARAIVERVTSHGVAATSVRVEYEEAQTTRSLTTVEDMLHSADLPVPVQARAVSAFRLLASAEAAAHGCEVDDVHFHEVGAVDSIMDVVGTCYGLHALGVEYLVASRVAVGAGAIASSHGSLPVPAPATASLLLGVPTTPGPIRPGGGGVGELTTPTGAALLRTCADEFGAWPAMTPVRVGYGAGSRDIGSPNVCRIVLGEGLAPLDLSTESVSVLETNVDHISGEAIAFAQEQLLLDGALDAWVFSIQMKKGRPGLVLSALVSTRAAQRFAETIMALTGTLGVRRYDIERYVADRRIEQRHTPYGLVRYKVGPAQTRPEADDVARIARERGLDFRSVERELRALMADDSE